jgi:hypothetical protein
MAGACHPVSAIGHPPRDGVCSGLVSQSPANEPEGGPAREAQPSSPPRAPTTAAPGTTPFVIAPLRTALVEAATHVRMSAAIIRAAPLDPPKTGRVAQVGYGFALPVATLRALIQDPLERRRYLLQASLRALVVLVVIIALAIWLPGYVELDPAADLKEKLARIAAVLSSAYAFVVAVEWILISLTHDYDDQIGRRAALAIGAPPEDPERPPRIRLDLPWIAKRMKRRFRGYRAYIFGVPAIFPISFAPIIGPALYAFALGGWTFYWFMVITASKSAAAWTEEGRAPDPWYLRLWDAAADSSFLFRWWLPRVYGRTLRKQTEAMFSPCKAVEDSIFPMIGLAMLRSITAIPGIYLFFRPFFPVAAARIIMHQAEAATASSSTAEAGSTALVQNAEGNE